MYFQIHIFKGHRYASRGGIERTPPPNMGRGILTLLWYYNCLSQSRLTPTCYRTGSGPWYSSAPDLGQPRLGKGSTLLVEGWGDGTGVSTDSWPHHQSSVTLDHSTNFALLVLLSGAASGHFADAIMRWFQNWQWVTFCDTYMYDTVPDDGMSRSRLGLLTNHWVHVPSLLFSAMMCNLEYWI